MVTSVRSTALLCLLACAFAPPAAAAPVVRLEVDAREAPRRIFHARLHVPAAAGPLTLHYPKWLPGEHGPTGPIADLAGLRFRAGDRVLEWVRDPAQLHTFHLTVPEGADGVEVSLDYLSPVDAGGFTSSATASDRLAVLSWNLVLLYPAGSKPSELLYEASLQLPAGWTAATALDGRREDPRDGEPLYRYAPVSLETLIDSPVLAGAHMVTLSLGAPGTPDAERERLQLASDSPAALAVPAERKDQLRRLVAEALALFGAHHYRRYQFLWALSDQVAHFGLEHHESSDNRTAERTFLDEDEWLDAAGLLPHEMVHSWNGKYRRPADLLIADFQQPMRTQLLWVYEGLTQHLGTVLTARAGLMKPEQAREALALVAAELSHRPGRSWRPLEDTATSAQVLYSASDHWLPWRRGVDFYDEGDLLWLEVDTILRRESRGRRSLDDFCRAFLAGTSGPAAVVPYGIDDVVQALEAVAPHDWRTFLRDRVQRVAERAPLGGIEAAGWRLDYDDKPNRIVAAAEERDDTVDASFSLGLRVGDDGTVRAVIPEMPAYEAGVGPGTKILGVNGRRFTKDRLRDAVQASKDPASRLELVVENGEFLHTLVVDYHGGPRHPHLVRNEDVPDLLAEIWKPRAR